MTLQEIHSKIQWDEYGIGHVDILVPVLGKQIAFELFTEDSKAPVISDNMFAIIQDVLSLPTQSIEQIKNLLWEECDFSFTVADYGCEPNEGETSKQAHFREFGLADREDAFNKSEIKSIQIDQENDEFTGRYAEIKVNSAADNLISIIVKNGKIIDYDDDGTYLGRFEKDEQHAHHSRVKVLNK